MGSGLGKKSGQRRIHICKFVFILLGYQHDSFDGLLVFQIRMHGS